MALEIVRQNPGPSTTKIERRNRSGQALEVVKISESLIAFYPRAINRPQPYVILFDHSSGILKHVDLQAVK
jgi:hypothetical protein